MTDLDEQRILSAFGQGEASARNGGYLSDNPHAYESVQWQAWREGFAFARGIATLHWGVIRCRP